MNTIIRPIFLVLALSLLSSISSHAQECDDDIALEPVSVVSDCGRKISIVPRLPLPPIIIVPVKRIEKEIEVSSFSVDSKIYGNLAQTTLIISFYNPNNRDVSADFIFPIPINSSINGYALDIGGAMVDGVAVEKNKARVTFEKIVRQGIDPGLIEKVAGNVFRARIYPLAAKQKRTIRIHFSSLLSQQGDTYDYQIPLMSGQLVNDFSLKIQAMNVAIKPIITSGQFKGLDFSQWNNVYVTEFNKKDFTIDKPITIEVPKLADNLVIVGKNSADEFYFSIKPQLKDKLTSTATKPNKINKIQLIWDASHSRFTADHQLELDLLKAFFNKYKHIEVELYLLRNQLLFEKNYVVNNGQWNDLKKRLEAVQYDGATNFTQLNKINNSSKADYILLFSDGLHTFSNKQKVSLSAPMYVFTSDLSGNTAYAQQLAEQNNGQSFQLSSQIEPKDLVAQIGSVVPQLISIVVNKGQVKKLPEFPYYLSSNQQPITAQLLSDTVSLTLNYGISGVIKQSIKVKINKQKAVDNKLPELIWAQQRLLYLEKNAKENRASIISLSQKYDLVSDFTSLIVLENLAQYLEHEIEPPKSLVQMRNGYFAQVKQTKINKYNIEKDKIQQVIAMWETRKTWWNKVFPKAPPKIIVKNVKRRVSNSSSNYDDDVALDRVVTTGSHIRAEDMEEMAMMESPSVAPEMKKEKSNSDFTASVKISEWDPDTPYLKALKKSKQSKRSALYYQLKRDYFNSPAFYFDSANFFFKNQQKDFGLQILSNIAELKIQDSRLLRTMAMKLKEHDYIDLSIQAYRKVLNDRPEEPQSYRDLALALQQRVVNNTSSDSNKDYQEGIELLYKVITTKWDRFNGIEVTVLMEINQMIPQLHKFNIDYSYIDEKLIALLDVDVRIVLGWDSDMTDIDLWVIEPSGEKVTYNKVLSGVGGMFHEDFTGGYGPEEYLIHRAPVGDYTVKVHFYGNNSPELSGATTLYVDVFTNYGRENQQKQTMSLRLENAGEDYLVGTINYKK